MAVDWKDAILTPPEFKDQVRALLDVDDFFDPCPHPRPDGFDGLDMDWEDPTYCNPPFIGGITKWVRKALAENDQGKTVAMALPIDRWVWLLIERCDRIVVLDGWYWMTPGGQKRKPSRPTPIWIMDGDK